MKQFHYGGQAVIEGVMMRGRDHFAVAVRKPGGEIETHSEPLAAYIYHGFVARTPFVRGLTMLWDALVIGLRALMFSADVQVGEEGGQAFSGPLAWGVMAIPLLAGVGLFLLLPAYLVGLADRYLASSLLSNLAEGGIRLSLFVGYVALIGLLPDVRRVFAYHGAEHKTVNACEGGVPLEPDAVAAYSTAHTRCGTTFLILVLLIFVVLGSFMGRPALWLRVLSRLLLLPVVAGLAYEVIKFSADRRRHLLVRVVTAPGLWLQRLTTREPDRSMLEVAIAALQKVREAESTKEVLPC